MGDGRVQALTIAYASGDTRHWRRLLDQIRQSQAWHGALQARHPGRHENIAPIPIFMLDWALSLGEYHRYAGDADFVADCWPNLVAVLRWFSAFAEAGLLRGVPHWSYIDWGDEHGLDLRGHAVLPALNAAWIGALRAAVELGEALGVDALPRAWSATADQAERALLARCFDPARDAFPDSVVGDDLGARLSQPTQCRVIAHCRLPEALRQALVERIFAADDPSVERISPAYVLHLARALRSCGRFDLALRLIRERFAPMIAAGATTTWERWRLYENDQRSHAHSASHGWGASAIAALLECATGLRILRPGGAAIALEPERAALPRFAGGIHLASGAVALRWDPDALELGLPAGMTARLRIDGAEHELAGGVHRFGAARTAEGRSRA
jgi:hypothetical protein